MSDISLADNVCKYYDNILFDEPFEKSKLPPTSAFYIANLEKKHMAWMKKLSVPRKDICGFFSWIKEDAEDMIRVLRNNTDAFLASRILDEERAVLRQQPQFKTDVMQKFYHDLSTIAFGTLDKGILSSRYVYRLFKTIFGKGHNEEEDIPMVFQQHADSSYHHHYQNNDTENQRLLQRMITGAPPIGAVKFGDPDFWGNVARRTIELKQAQLTWIPQHLLDSVQLQYYIICRSLGYFVDPFSLRMSLTDATDPVHYASGDSLLAFVHHEPSNALSKSVKDICRRMVHSIMNANDTQFPFGEVLYRKNNESLLQLMQNVRLLNDTVPRVRSRHTPPILVDVLFRLLALTKYHVVWEEVVPPSSKNNDDDDDSRHYYNFFRLYTRIIALQTENAALRKILSKNQDELLDVQW